MSSYKATFSSHKDEQLSSLVIITGRDCAPGRFLSQQSPDLWVKGGSLIEKTLCVGGNIGVEGFLIGNVCSELVLTSQIQEKFFGEGIISSGNIMMQNDDHLYVNNIQARPGSDLCLSAEPGQSVAICGGDCLDLNGGDLCNVGNINAAGLNLQCGNIDNVNTLTISRLEGSNCNGTEVSIVSDAYFLQEAQVEGNLLVFQNEILSGDLCTFGETMLKGNATINRELLVSGDSNFEENIFLGNKVIFGDAIVIGDLNSTATGNTQAIVVGKQASAGDDSIVVGHNAIASGTASVSVGFAANSTSDHSIAIGINATTGNVGNAICLGREAGTVSLDAAHPLAFGGITSGITAEVIGDSTHTLGIVIDGVQYKILLTQ